MIKLLLFMVGIMIVAFMLSGCATVAPCEPVEVKIPVRVSCITTIPQRPVSPIQDLTEDATDFDKIQAVTIDWFQQKQYINTLEAIVEGCTF